MNSKVIKLLAAGALVYGLFVVAVIAFYPEKSTNPDDMEWQDREQFNKLHIGKLNLGQSRNEIITLLGSPDISEAKQTDSASIQIMFYRTQHVEADGKTTANECTPLVFENDVLVAWGQNAYLEYVDG